MTHDERALAEAMRFDGSDQEPVSQCSHNLGASVGPCPFCAIRVGDLMRMSVEFVDALKADPLTNIVLVRVKEVRQERDGTKMLWMENA